MRSRDPRSSSGRTADFESVNGGSNPPRGANASGGNSRSRSAREPHNRPCDHQSRRDKKSNSAYHNESSEGKARNGLANDAASVEYRVRGSDNHPQHNGDGEANQRHEYQSSSGHDKACASDARRRELNTMSVAIATKTMAPTSAHPTVTTRIRKSTTGVPSCAAANA